jgi:hypothetical protein
VAVRWGKQGGVPTNTGYGKRRFLKRIILHAKVINMDMGVVVKTEIN